MRILTRIGTLVLAGFFALVCIPSNGYSESAAEPETGECEGKEGKKDKYKGKDKDKSKYIDKKGKKDKKDKKGKREGKKERKKERKERKSR